MNRPSAWMICACSRETAREPQVADVRRPIENSGLSIGTVALLRLDHVEAWLDRHVTCPAPRRCAWTDDFRAAARLAPHLDIVHERPHEEQPAAAVTQVVRGDGSPPAELKATTSSRMRTTTRAAGGRGDLEGEAIRDRCRCRAAWRLIAASRTEKARTPSASELRAAASTSFSIVTALGISSRTCLAVVVGSAAMLQGIARPHDSELLDIIPLCLARRVMEEDANGHFSGSSVVTVLIPVESWLWRR
jgi:hypothetical protein